MQSTFPSNGRPIRLDAILPSTPGPHPALLLLHGSGGNHAFWFDRIAPVVSQFSLAVFSVHYFDATSTTRANLTHLTDGLHVPIWLQTTRDALAHIAAHPAVSPTRIALLGISLGAYMALALGADPALAPPVKAIVEVSGGLVSPFDTQATSAFPPTLILHGADDTVVPVANAHALDTLLTRLQVPHQILTLPGEGHWFSAPAQFQLLAAIASFLAQHL